jgi:GNAT superfamily N-acetyltransferase
MEEIVEKILLADILVFATPIYTWQATAKMKAVMDRMYGLNKFYGGTPRNSLNIHQSYALIATCGYDLDYGAGLLDEAVRRWCNHSGLPYLGMYAVRDEDDLASFQTDNAVQGARQFAQRILEKGTGVSVRRYDMLSDFTSAYNFLEETYDANTLNSYLLPQYFEYAHYLQWFDSLRAHRMGLWENEGKIVGISAYEMNIGTAHIHAKNTHTYLLRDMLYWAEKEISISENGKRSLNVWITSEEPEKQHLLTNSGYQFVRNEAINIFRYTNAFVERQLPEGYEIIDGTQVDYAKLAECFWRGFDHDEIPPDENIDGNIKCWNAPHADKSLMTIVIAPNGEYACALGMWFDECNKYAYIEPLATVPKHRRMGLATIALTEAMKKTKALGAEYCFGGAGEFYTAIGFETICYRELWKKEWDA